jgi:hypothetical protein
LNIDGYQMRGGRRPGAGKPAGAKNRKKTIETQAAIEVSGMTPFDYMISVMRDERNDPRTRLEAAHHAAPYVHSKLTASELTVNEAAPVDRETLVAGLKQLIASAPKLVADMSEVLVPDDQPAIRTYETPDSGHH